MPRPLRSGVFVCVAVVALAAFLPGFSTFDWAVFEPEWVLLPDSVSVAVSRTADPTDEQLVPFFALLPSRAPPSIPFV